MAHYYVNDKAQTSGEHEVHTGSCSYLPSAENRTYLGSFDNCTSAVKEAKKTYSTADGCYFCSEDCHKK